MRGSSTFCSFLAGATLLATSAYAADANTIAPIEINGKHFFYSDNKEEFFIRGVAYQPGYNQKTGAFANQGFTDPIANGKDCKRDIPYLKQLRTNAIRIYAIDPKSNHDDCMNQFAAAGIYVLADLSSPLDSINPYQPAWTTTLFTRYAQVVDALAGYNNVIGFFAGNEVINWPNQTYATPYVKAAVRDTKAYIKSQYTNRPLYVGYATADVPVRNNLANYFNCGDQDDAVDFWGYNIYSWCSSTSTYVSSHYKARTDFFETYSVPVFFAEYGCITDPPRLWTDVPTLYGPQMAPVWSGGIAYQYFQTQNGYGLVTVNGDTVKPLPNFKALEQEIAKATPSSTAYASINTGTVRSCPADSGSWHAQASPLPPPANEELCSCLESSLSCVVKSSLPMSKYKDEFGFICGAVKGVCDAIDNIPKQSIYGAYSPCSPSQKLSYVMDQYYLSQKSEASACNFKGAAEIVSPSLSGRCKALLGQVNKNQNGGGGSAPEPTHSKVASGGNGGGSSSAPKVGVSSFHLCLYVAVGVLTGAAMIIL